ncbi:uncharacterized protein LOC129216713 [Uloborus diversus]|uniref:uncharacterized protein LOC129216713 n=1 Tax=Uloborus diversus TaxID=327109 RepID=UPI002409BE35|nr:uncharacterized protein LOC129216713 [Uloborus diversus]
MTCEKVILDLQTQKERPLNSQEEYKSSHRVQNNRMMLDLRQKIQWQSQVIKDLKAQRDRLTRELDSRLFFVEAQLQREQKHIEALLSEKDQYIQFQSLQIQSLKYILSHIDSNERKCCHKGRSVSCGRRSKAVPPPGKRYSVALDEYMRESGGIISRAQPVVVQVEADCDNKAQSHHSPCSRTRSLPELRFCNEPEYENLDFAARQIYCYDSVCSSDHLSQNVIDELAVRRWTSDCDSENSDSLDSGISSPSIKSRNIHLSEENFSFPSDVNVVKANTMTPRRSSTIGNFINRTFSSSSTQLEKIKDAELVHQETISSGRRHNSFSEVKSSEMKQKIDTVVKQPEEHKSTNRFISSANRNFGTNHRNVTKPRDIKFRKLFKFRRRNEIVNPEPPSPDDYMTV